MADQSNKGNVRDKVQEMAGAARQTAQEAGHRAQEAASNVANQARDVASRAGQQADNAMSSVGESISSLAGTIRENAPQEGMIGNAAGAVADRLQSSGLYLQEHGLGDITDDLGSVIRRYPLPAVGLALGLGFLLGMGMASRR